MVKGAIVILSDIETQSANVLNALETVKEFKEAGDDVQLIFDGYGVKSAVAIAGPEHGLYRLYSLVADKTAGICRYCAGSFEVYNEAEGLGLPMLAEYDQHLSIRSRVAAGYQVITF